MTRSHRQPARRPASDPDDLWCQDDNGLPPMPEPMEPLRGTPGLHDDHDCAQKFLVSVVKTGQALVPRDLRECTCLYVPSSGRDATDAQVWNAMVEHYDQLVCVPVTPSVRQRCQQVLDEGVGLVTSVRELMLTAVINAGPLTS